MSTLKDVLDDVEKIECFGYVPRSSSTKPAHVANGWFRHLLGKRFDPILLNQTVIHWSRKAEVNPSEKLIQDFPTVFSAFQLQAQRQAFAEFRADLKSLVSPIGGAVNSGNSFSSYNITNERQITEDRSDQHTGHFLAQLLKTDLGNGPSPAVQLIMSILTGGKDEVSTVIAPLLAQAKETPVLSGNYPAPSVFRKRENAFGSRVLRHLRTGFDNLSAFESRCGGDLDALRRLVSFGVFAVVLHMHNRFNEMSKVQGLNPVLLYFQEKTRSTAYHASHATYNLNRRAIESLYTMQFRAWLAARVGERVSDKNVEAFIKTLQFDKKGGEKDKKGREALMRSYKSFATGLNNIDAFAEALRETLFRFQTADPLEFYRALGVRSGFVRPAGNAVRKFYTLEGVLLEAVLASILPDGELSYAELLDELSKRYGLIVGGRSKDSALLMEHGIGSATVQDLQANSRVFRQRLISLGWARQYADGVLMVQVPEGMQ